MTYQLIDDGTLDTVIRATCAKCQDIMTLRYSQETAQEYREMDGALDLPTFIEEIVKEDEYAFNWCQCYMGGER